MELDNSGIFGVISAAKKSSPSKSSPSGKGGVLDVIGTLKAPVGPAEGNQLKDAQAGLAAASSGNLAALETLVTEGRFPLNTLDPATGETALTCAIKGGHLDVVKMLIGKGADASILNSAGRDALMRAARRGDAHIVEALVPVSDPRRVDMLGWSAFANAAAKGNIAALKVLAPISLTGELDIVGRSAATLAKAHGHDEAATFINPRAYPDPEARKRVADAKARLEKTTSVVKDQALALEQRRRGHASRTEAAAVEERAKPVAPHRPGGH